jgi:uncharacterized membrane protein
VPTPTRHNWAVYAIATFAFVALITLIITRLATGALIATGLPPPIARFQARSAYSGSGFTTLEAENVVNHPVRRRVIYTLMMIGNLGTPTLVVTVVLGFVAPGPGDTPTRLLTLFAVLLVISAFLSSPPLTRWLERAGSRYANRQLLEAFADEPRELLDLGDDFVVCLVPLAATPGDEAIRSLRALRTHLEGVDVLGVRQRNGGTTVYRGASPTDIELKAGDALVVHGPRATVQRLTTAAPT